MTHYQRQQFLSDTTLAAIQQSLEKIAHDAKANLALLSDPTGQELAYYGQLGANVVETISALSASQMGASHELVNALRLSPNFSLLIREGQDYNYFLSAPADRYILLLVVTAETPLGWVRHVLKRSHTDLGALLANVEEESETAQPKEGTMSPDFVTSLLNTMDGFWEGNE